MCVCHKNIRCYCFRGSIMVSLSFISSAFSLRTIYKIYKLHFGKFLFRSIILVICFALSREQYYSWLLHTTEALIVYICSFFSVRYTVSLAINAHCVVVYWEFNSNCPTSSRLGTCLATILFHRNTESIWAMHLFNIEFCLYAGHILLKFRSSLTYVPLL